jgi:dihydropyrimidine dehydrogenase (NAD+) subunit PreT
MVGTALILTNLLYLVRRRLAWLSLGSLPAWLDLHVFTGLSGSALILFHSAFQLRTPIATVTSVALIIVVITGLIGRYIYALTPKTGDLPLEERLRELDLSLPSFARDTRTVLAQHPITKLPASANILRVFWTIPRWLVQARARRRAVLRTARENAEILQLLKSSKKPTKLLVRDISRLAASELDRIAGGALLRLWRGLHRYMAILMLLTVGVHIGVAWYYGYRWIWSE